MSLITPVPEHVRERWRTAVRFSDVLDREAKTLRNPFPARVVTWFNFCRVCQDWEEQMLLEGDTPPEDRQLHKALLSSAIATGEALLLEAHDSIALAPLNLSPSAVAAKVESLRITFDQRHTELDPTRQAAVLRERAAALFKDNRDICLRR